MVAQRLAEERLDPILDLGCGEGRFVYPARKKGLSVVALDFSATMLTAVPGPRVHGDACRLPFRSGVFGGIVALYMLYHLTITKRGALIFGRRPVLGGRRFV